MKVQQKKDFESSHGRMPKISHSGINTFVVCFNAHAEPENPCSVETICFFWMPLYVDCGVLIVGKDLTSHLTDTFLVCVCRTY